MEVVDFHGALGSFHAVFIGGADDRSAFGSTAGHHAAETASPVVASAAVVDAWSASEFTEHDDQSFFQKAICFEIRDQRCDARIHRIAVVAHGVENIAVVIESASVHLYETDTFFYKATSE